MDLIYDPYYFIKTIPNIDNNKLREPQKQAYIDAIEHFHSKEKETHAIIVLPTGVGKTGLMGLLPYGISEGRVLIITPQLVIKDNVVGSLDPEFPDNFWLTTGVFKSMSELPVLVEYEGDDTSLEWLEAANIVVVNIQKLQSRLTSSLINRVPPDFFDMIIIDEAHHSTASTWIEALQYFSRAKVIKLTGTPYRTDGEKIVGKIICEYKLSSAMAHGYVKSLECFTYVPGNLLLTIDEDESKQYSVDELLQLGIKDKDWISRSVAYSEECSAKIVKESIKKLEAKLSFSPTIPHKIIAVACSIKHAEQIKSLYEKEGYKTALIHSGLSKEDKESSLADVENHRVQVVINVAMLGEGYDHPYLSVGAIFRPFRSLLPYAQFIGRVLRAIPEAEHPSDNVAEIVTHQDLFLDNLWEYYKQEIQDAETIKYMSPLDLEAEASELAQSTHSRQVDASFGKASEIGLGSTIKDSYITTELLKEKEQQDQELNKKIKVLQELLNLSEKDATALVHQAQGQTALIKRPDLFVKRKRKGVDARIKEEIVPEILDKFGLDLKSNELTNSRLFSRKYRWIPLRRNENGAVLAIYITVVLNDMIGAQRDDWTLSDWDIAEQKLNQIKEYIERVLEEELAS